MNKNSLLSFVLLAVLASGASAAQSSSQSELVVLPTYTVEAPRYSPAEQQVNQSLDSLRALARTPVTVSPELPAAKVQLVQADKPFSSYRLAKS
jgi:ABC-type oligopeptide transport system substrate-binding subunit